MLVKLIDALDNEYTFPDGFGLQELAPSPVSLALSKVIGRNGGAVDIGASSLAEKSVVIKGKIMDATLLDAGQLQAARASAMADYYEIQGFVNNARQYGPIRIYRETGIVIDPTDEDYDADLAPLGYCLLGYYVGGSAPPFWGAFGHAPIDLTLQFTCPRPYWQGHFNDSSATGALGTGSPLSVPFTVLGTVPASPQIVLYSAAGLSVPADKSITLTIGTLEVEWTGDIPAAGYIVFDCESGQVFSASAMSAAGRIEWTGTPTTNKASGLLDTDDWSIRQWDFATGAHELVVSSDMESPANITAHVRFANEYYG